MTFDRYWVTKEREEPAPSTCSGKVCPYFKKTCSVASYSFSGQCLAWKGYRSRFSTAKDIQEYCQKDYHTCPFYKEAMGLNAGEYETDDAGAWPSL